MDLSDIDDYDFNIVQTEIHRADGRITKNIQLTVKKPINLPLIIISALSLLILNALLFSVDETSVFPLSTVASVRDYFFQKLVKPFKTDIILAVVNILIGGLLAVRVKVGIAEVVRLQNIVKDRERRQEDLEYLAYKHNFLNDRNVILSAKNPPSYRTKSRFINN